VLVRKRKLFDDFLDLEECISNSDLHGLKTLQQVNRILCNYVADHTRFHYEN
jgi:hypothetical protein